jgi:hypothetical protein
MYITVILSFVKAAPEKFNKNKDGARKTSRLSLIFGPRSGKGVELSAADLFSQYY